MLVSKCALGFERYSCRNAEVLPAERALVSGAAGGGGSTKSLPTDRSRSAGWCFVSVHLDALGGSDRNAERRLVSEFTVWLHR